MPRNDNAGNKNVSNEQQFIAEIGRYAFIVQDMAASVTWLDAWRDGLTKALAAKRSPIKGLKSNSALAGQMEAVHNQVLACMAAWSQQWDNRAPAKAISDAFGDQAILLVFGKVNAGKSSFCNFLVDRFVAQGKSAQYFYIDEGRVVDTPGRFKEGVTETTSRIQGVRLGEKLVLLDTPGLHSVTPENGELTHRFTDSADAVLWLTSSTSPGQVQELDELRRELQSGKPLLPVVTKSDVWEEDEVDGEIQKLLRNKTADNRAEQERDVGARAAKKLQLTGLDVGLLRQPVSVSAFAAREQLQTPQALDEAGFERLYAELQGIAQRALAYKRSKAAAVMLHHLEENVLGALRGQVLPQLGALNESSRSTLVTLKERKPQIISAVERVVVSALPRILEKHESTRDVRAVCAQISTLTLDELSKHMQEALGDYAVAMDTSLAQLSPDGMVGFEDRAVEVEVRKGAVKQAATSAAGAAGGVWAGAQAGAALGTVVPVVGNALGAAIGAVFGGLLGGFMGRKAGGHFEETELQRRVVGVSYERLHAALEGEARKNLPKLVTNVVEQCQDAICLVAQEVARLEDIVRTHEYALVELKDQIRHDPV